jgi:hypothetical protein
MTTGVWTKYVGGASPGAEIKKYNCERTTHFVAITEKAKCCYYNRTWERFEFETVISKLLDKTDRLTARQKAKFKTTLSKYQ